MPYPVAYRGQERRGSQPPGRPYSPRTRPPPGFRPPRPGNDNIPRPANDNYRQLGRTAGRVVQVGSFFVRLHPAVRVAWTAFQIANELGVFDNLYAFAFGQRLHAPGYTANLQCGSGGHMSFLEGFNFCGSFIIDTAAWTGPWPFAPATFWTWRVTGPTLNPYDPASYVQANAGVRYVKTDASAAIPSFRTAPRMMPNPWTDIPAWLEFLPLPGLRPQPQPVPIPWGAIPHRPATGLPEGSSHGPSPRRRVVSQAFRPGTTLVLNPGPGRPPVLDPDPPVQPPRPPRPREKEKKVHARTVAGTAVRVVDAVGEGVDFLEAFYKALPWSVRKLYGRRPKPQDMSHALWNYWDEVDIGLALRNLALNEVEDRAFGLAGQGNARLARQNPNRPLVGLQFGPVI